MLFGKAKEFQQCHGPSTAGFSFEAGGRTFPSVVFHSMSGTLMLKVEEFFIFCYYYHLFFLLKPLINLLDRKSVV